MVKLQFTLCLIACEDTLAALGHAASNLASVVLSGYRLGMQPQAWQATGRPGCYEVLCLIAL